MRAQTEEMSCEGIRFTKQDLYSLLKSMRTFLHIKKLQENSLLLMEFEGNNKMSVLLLLSRYLI